MARDRSAEMLAESLKFEKTPTGASTSEENLDGETAVLGLVVNK